MKIQVTKWSERKGLWGALMVAVVAGLIAGQFGAVGVARADDGYNLTTIGPWQTDVYRKWCRAGEQVVVAIRGAGRSDLDLRVCCPHHDLVVASDTDATDYCVVRFRAPETGVYKFEVDEVDGRADAYEIGFASTD